MNESTPSLIARGSIAAMSGYLVVLSSELREKILMLPANNARLEMSESGSARGECEARHEY